ncbi:hypothetical protein J2W80_001359 [Methylorubrum extorquens]|nr:hypothetical protein [Methylorubrum extorquens]
MQDAQGTLGAVAADHAQLGFFQHALGQFAGVALVLDHEGDAGVRTLDLRRRGAFSVIDPPNQGGEMVGNALGDEVVVAGGERLPDLIEFHARQKRIIGEPPMRSVSKRVVQGETILPCASGPHHTTTKRSGAAQLRRRRIFTVAGPPRGGRPQLY